MVIKLRGEKGTKALPLEMLILRILSEGDAYGYEISQLIRDYSEDAITIAEGAMYPVLYRMVDKGYVSDYKKKVGKRMERVYYHIEEYGQLTLQELIEEYRKTVNGALAVLEHESSNMQGVQNE